MSSATNSVVIVTAFGRADAFAASLQQSGFSVTLLDCSDFLAQGQDSGVGPFPLVSGLKSLVNIESSLKAHDLPRGISLWLREGPLEMNGPMAEYQREQSRAMRFLFEGGSLKRRSEDFSVEWLSQYMFQMASPWMGDSTKAHQYASIFPFKENLLLLNNATFIKGLKKACSDVGVKRHQVKKWLEMTLLGRKLMDLHFETEAGLMIASAPSFVWTLSSWESQRLNPELAAEMFSQNILTPEWQWVRLDLRSSVGAWISGIPYWSTVIEDVYLPWSHANAFILQKGAGGNWDVWLKIPFNRLGDPASWHSWARAVEAVLLKRLPHGQWVCDESSLKTYPQGLVFDVEQKNWHAPTLGHFHYVAHEVLPRLDFACWFDSLEKLQAKIEDSRSREIKKAKGARSDQALHAP